MPQPPSTPSARRVASHRSALRAHILAALGAAGCSSVPEATVPTFDGMLYDRIDKDFDGSYASVDCNDSDASIHPGAVEVCNDVDDNCDGAIDEGVRAVFHRDADGDSFGSPDDTIDACELPDGYVHNDSDCNDRAAEANPDGVEVCDGLDNDCDGGTDNLPAYWPDEDGDGFGSSTGTPATECAPMPDGYAPNESDCDDSDATVFPGAPELCMDGRDNNCDGRHSCVQLDVALEASESDCSVTWAMEDAVVYSPACVGCDFRFDADLVVSLVTGDASLCDAAVDARRLFIVNGSDITGSVGSFYDVEFYARGSWYDDTLYWAYDPTRLALEDGSYALFSYMGELAVYELEYYYYSYYYYEGRPLSVDGDHRIADRVRRADWCSEGAEIAALELTVEERARAVQAWTRAGLAEHASVASFNRFAMELMSIGAPPDLLMESLQAASDEIAHARDCFGVASALSGVPVGPGALPIDGILHDTSLEGILTRLLTEGCVEETISTALAAQRLAHATHPRIRATLERIVADETRHAALAWRSARWILDQHPRLMPLARRVLAEAMAEQPPSDGAAVSPALRAHGVLARSERARERTRTMRAVVAPAVAALLGDQGERGETSHVALV